MLVSAVFAVAVVAIAVAPLSQAIDRAARRANVSHMELALSQGITPAQWSRQLAGEPSQHVALDRLANAPLSFRQALLEELFAAWGVEKPLTAREVVELLRGQVLASGGLR